ncbi:MAG: hypothetical protein J5736_03120 [Bacilli bacterium]|nr:hypothetical protein [Bacilli bacterium]
MKKSVVVLVMAIALLSIILVAFTGATYTIVDDQTVYVKKIVLDNKTLFNPADTSKMIYSVLERESHLAENPDEEETFVRDREENLWFDYVIQIRDFNYFYDNLGHSLQLQAHAEPDNATNRSLRFSGREKDEIYATVSPEGMVEFPTKLEEIADISVSISAKDGSKIESHVRIQSWWYI